MKKDLYKIDEVFKKAHERYRDQPSKTAWEKISSSLNDEDVEKYKKGFITWKRIAIFLSLILIFLFIGESAFFHNGGALISTFLPKEKQDSNYERNDKNGLQNRNSNSQRPIAQQNKNENSSNQFHESEPRGQKGANAVRTNSKINFWGDGRNKNKAHPIHDSPVYDDIASNSPAKNFIKGNADASVFHQPTIEKINISFQAPLEIRPTISSANSSNAKAVVDPERTDAFKPGWYITVFGSSDWGSYRLDNDYDNYAANNVDQRQEIYNRERHEPSFSIGAFATRRFRNKWAWKTGLIYSNTDLGIEPQQVYATNAPGGSVAYKFITSSGYNYITPGFGVSPAIGDSIQSAEAQHTLTTISLPFMISYWFEKNRFSIAPAAGVTGNFIARATIETEITDAQNREAVFIDRLKGMKTFYIGFIADLDLKYRISPKWFFSVLPTIKYAVSPITKSNVVKTFPQSFGISGAIAYKF
jgi:hypothetical protein